MQCRQDGTIAFHRASEAEYGRGFGNLAGEFWLGLQHLASLTGADRVFRLRIELTDSQGKLAVAEYDQAAAASLANLAASVSEPHFLFSIF